MLPSLAALPLRSGQAPVGLTFDEATDFLRHAFFAFIITDRESRKKSYSSDGQKLPLAKELPSGPVSDKRMECSSCVLIGPAIPWNSREDAALEYRVEVERAVNSLKREGFTLKPGSLGSGGAVLEWKRDDSPNASRTGRSSTSYDEENEAFFENAENYLRGNEGDASAAGQSSAQMVRTTAQNNPDEPDQETWHDRARKVFTLLEWMPFDVSDDMYGPHKECELFVLFGAGGERGYCRACDDFQESPVPEPPGLLGPPQPPGPPAPPTAPLTPPPLPRPARTQPNNSPPLNNDLIAELRLRAAEFAKRAELARAAREAAEAEAEVPPSPYAGED